MADNLYRAIMLSFCCVYILLLLGYTTIDENTQWKVISTTIIVGVIGDFIYWIVFFLIQKD